MAKSHSLEEEKLKRRAREAKLRLKLAKEKKARSTRIDRALKKAAIKDEELRRVRKINAALKRKVKKLEKELKKETFEKEFAQAQAGLRSVADVSFSKEEVEAGKKALEDYYFGESTAEQRLVNMRAMWRESEALVGGPRIPRFGQLVMWVQRNGFELAEFWAEYRRRRQ